MHAFAVTTTSENTASKAVDDKYFAIAHDVVFIAGEQLLGFERIIEVAHQLRVLWGV